MNHIYKTIFNKKTGQVVVVAENATSSYKSHSSFVSVTEDNLVQKISGVKYFKKTVLSLSTGVFLLSSLYSSSSFSADIYDGTSTGVQLQTAGNISGNLGALLGEKLYKG